MTRKLNKITYLPVSEGSLYPFGLWSVGSDEICAGTSTSLGLVNVCRCFTLPVVPWKGRRELRWRETRSGREKLGRRIAVVLQRVVYNGFFSFFKLGMFRSVGNIAASLVIEILGVLFKRTSQQGYWGGIDTLTGYEFALSARDLLESAE